MNIGEPPWKIYCELGQLTVLFLESYYRRCLLSSDLFVYAHCVYVCVCVRVCPFVLCCRVCAAMGKTTKKKPRVTPEQQKARAKELRKKQAEKAAKKKTDEERCVLPRLYEWKMKGQVLVDGEEESSGFEIPLYKL